MYHGSTRHHTALVMDISGSPQYPGTIGILGYSISHCTYDGRKLQVSWDKSAIYREKHVSLEKRSLAV